MTKRRELSVTKDDYAKIKEISAKRASDASLIGRDISPIPKVENKRRRARSKKSFQRFCEYYFPLTFSLKWSKDHLLVIKRIETAVRDGGLFAMAMPRGFGKTSLCEAACLWAELNGYHDFIALIGADLAHATDMLDSIKSELEHNDLLLEDFPEVCYPIRQLEGIYQRSGGQICDGKPTSITWTASQLRLPTIPHSCASGGIIRVAGIGGRIRGMKAKKADGLAVRPSLIILDDPQTDESARSPQQITYRLELLNGAILNLAAPGIKISGIMPCTVIYPNDMADRILDKSKYPSWHGERTSLVKSFPTNEKLWEEYVAIRNADLSAGGAGVPATKFYRQNRKAMDQGAEVAWAQWKNSDEISAIQHAMNLRFRDEGGERAFWSEFQNQPLPPEEELAASRLSKETILSKLNGLGRGVVPPGTLWLTSFVDVQGEALFWMVCAWESNFTGSIINYGVWPPQPTNYFTLSKLPVTLSSAIKGAAGLEGRLYAGLEELSARWLSKEWSFSDGDVMSVGQSLFDANWARSTDIVYRFCRQSAQSATYLPTHGKYYGASSLPMSDYRKKPGDIVGLNWRIPGRSAARRVRYGIYDTNFWKSFILARFCTIEGDSGSMSLFGKDVSDHHLLIDHLSAEFCVKTSGRGRTVDEWKIPGTAQDNHWFDCLVGCTAAASMLGSALFKPIALTSEKSIKLSVLAKQKKEARKNG